MIGAQGRISARDLQSRFHSRADRNIVIWAIGCCIHSMSGYATAMGVTTVVTALAGLGALLAAVVIGVLMVLGNRGHDSRMSDRVRRFFIDRKREDRGL